MRHILRFIFLLLLAHIAKAQVVNFKIDNDPVFATVLSRRMTYPIEAERLGIYAKIYAGFRIDQKGHIQDVIILNPNKIGFGFEEEVVKKMKLIPSLNPKYGGDYALPIVFALSDYTNTGTVMSPTGHLASMQLKNRILLSEIRVVSSKPPVHKGNELAPFTRSIVPNK